MTQSLVHDHYNIRVYYNKQTIRFVQGFFENFAKYQNKNLNNLSTIVDIVEHCM